MPADRQAPARTVVLRPLEEPPFDAVVAAIGELSPDETVEIVVAFAPVPLYDVLDRRGWAYVAERLGPDEWRVRVGPAGADDPAGDARRRSGERLRRPRTDRPPRPHTPDMSDTTLDVRDVPPAERHPKIHDAFAELAAGETLTIVNDHEPKPLFYEFAAEVDAFDADAYEVERRAPDEFVAHFPKE